MVETELFLIDEIMQLMSYACIWGLLIGLMIMLIGLGCASAINLLKRMF